MKVEMQGNYGFYVMIYKEKHMTKEDMKKGTGMSSATIAKLGKNENINMKSLEKICEVLECDIKDVIEFIPEIER